SFLPLHVYWLVSKRPLGAETVEMFCFLMFLCSANPPKNSPYIHVHGLDTAPERNDGAFRDSCDLAPTKNHSGGSACLPRPMSQTPGHRLAQVLDSTSNGGTILYGSISRRLWDG
ncbi:hypothetical protein B0J15DRAFT_480066, partial [Fusarium solani]